MSTTPDLYTRFIKISKIDGNGIDNTNSLLELTTITLPWSNGEIARYKVIGSSQKQTYFDYVVEFQSTSSLYYPDASTLDYNFTASYSEIPFRPNPEPISPPTFIPPIQEYPTPPTSSTFSIIDNKLILDTYPQKDIEIQISGTLQVRASNPYDIRVQAQINTPSGNYIPPSYKIPSGAPLSFVSKFLQRQTTTQSPFIGRWFFPSGSLVPGSVFSFTTEQLSPAPPQNPEPLSRLELLGMKLTVSSSIGTRTSLLTNIEPYLQYRFKNSNCDVLQNNALISRPNNQLQDIDYTTSQTIPVNYQALLNYQAKKATFPKSYFTSTSLINPSYGSSNTIKIYNTGSSFNTQVSAGTIVLVYSGISGSVRTTEDVQQSSDETSTFDFTIKYLFDANQNLIEAIPTEQNIRDAQYNFIPNSTTSSPIGFVSPFSGSLGSGSLNPLFVKYPIIDPTSGAALSIGNTTSIYAKDGTIFLRCTNANEALGAVYDSTTTSSSFGINENNSKGIIFAQGIEYTTAKQNIDIIKEKLLKDNLL